MCIRDSPEGLAVGLAFAVAADTGGDAVTLASAIALAIGMALQNIPEGDVYKRQSTLWIIVPTGIAESGNALPGLMSASAPETIVSPTLRPTGAMMYLLSLIHI